MWRGSFCITLINDNITCENRSYTNPPSGENIGIGYVMTEELTEGMTEDMISER